MSSGRNAHPVLVWLCEISNVVSCYIPACNICIADHGDIFPKL